MRYNTVRVGAEGGRRKGVLSVLVKASGERGSSDFFISLVKEEQAQMRAEFREDLGELRRERHERFDRINERLDDMHYQMIVQTRWLIGSIAFPLHPCTPAPMHPSTPSTHAPSGGRV